MEILGLVFFIFLDSFFSFRIVNNKKYLSDSNGEKKRKKNYTVPP